MRNSASDQGMTLLELVAVLAIFSVLALVSVNLLSSGLNSRNRIAEADSAVADMAATVAVLRRDLETMAPVALAGEDRPVFRADRNGGLVFARLSAGNALETVTWRVDPAAGVLLRNTRGFGASGETIETVRLAGVSAWRLRVSAGGGEWREASGWAGSDPGDLPVAVEAVLSLDELGEIRVVVAR